ncbi:hypothetical protein HHI36_003421 [Cryptolaemus montrouzieri]|uniref:JmjC domain-containing protein n=1 Tax=Cryptolaemus montrouzieri TaxID=559131 RepID=A0ABD2PDC6_9CUCU
MECTLVKKLISKTLKIIKVRDELKTSIKISNSHICNRLHKCFCKIFENREVTTKILLDIESILDYVEDEINIGHWSKVPLDLRRTYTIASFIKMVLCLKFHKNNIDINKLREILRCIDKGLLLGAPLKNNPELLTKAATILSKSIHEHFPEHSLIIESESGGDLKSDEVCNQPQFMFSNIDALEIDFITLPSLEHFSVYFRNQHPLKLQGCIDHWPARTKWKNIEYLIEMAGDRTVPVEIGTQYVDENWSQKLMTLKEFIEKYYIKKEDCIGYLAQHNLFDQIPELKKDIGIPEYCTLCEDYDNFCDPEINCWFGPGGTVSSLHYDPKHNLLAQIYGTKQVLLFAPSDTQFLYPYEETLLRNTSQVDPMMPNLELYPNFKKAKMYKCLLNEGEVLYIPKKWWHHVIALDRSFSVSFWWQ